MTLACRAAYSILKRVLLGCALLWPPLATGGSAADLRIAVVVSETAGPSGGGEARLAAGLAIAGINAAGGINGVPLKAEFHDDHCDPRRAEVLAAAFAADPAIAAVVGHRCRTAANAAHAVYAKSGIVTIATAPAGLAPFHRPSPADPPAPWFEMAPAASAAGRFIAAALTGSAGGNGARIALVADPTRAMQTLLRDAGAELTARGNAPVLAETFPPGSRDFSALAARLATAGTTHLALLAYPTEGLLLAGEVVRLGLDIAIVAPDAFAATMVTDPALARRIGIVLSPEIQAYPQAQRLGAALRAAGLEASRQALWLHAAIEAVAAGLRRSHSIGSPGGDDRARLAAALRLAPVATTLGPLAFSADGQSSLSAWRLYGWQDGVLLPR